jgi:ferric iron reductase protein FhuF
MTEEFIVKVLDRNRKLYEKGDLFKGLVKGDKLKELIAYLQVDTNEKKKNNIDNKKYTTVEFTEGQIMFQLKQLIALLGDEKYNQNKVKKDIEYLCKLIEKFYLGEIITDINFCNREKRREIARRNKKNKKIRKK